MISNEILNEIAQQTFDDYGRVSATFEPHTDLKVKWMRQGDHGWIEFQITDYLDHAPEHVIRGILEAIRLKLKGEMDVPYPPEVIEYLTSNSFRLEGLDCNIERRIKRMKKRYPDLDYDVELPENSRIHDALTELQDEGVQVSPVMVGTTCEMFGNAVPWVTSTLFKESVPPTATGSVQPYTPSASLAGARSMPESYTAVEPSHIRRRNAGYALPIVFSCVQ